MAVTVTKPLETGDTARFCPKSIVAATPITDPLSLTLTPVPEAVTPVNPDPSPKNLVAVIIPAVVLDIVEKPETFN